MRAVGIRSLPCISGSVAGRVALWSAFLTPFGLDQVLGWDCGRNHFEKAIVLDSALFGLRHLARPRTGKL